ncbi:MAG: S1 family peptidase [Acidimicrobiales bacterium]
MTTGRGAISALIAVLAVVASTVGADATPTTPTIIGGEPVPDGKYPFQVALLDETLSGDDYDKQFCGGSLIGSHWVLTAAHCVTDDGGQEIDPAGLAVAVGRTVLTSELGERFAAAEIRLHPGFRGATLSNDAALIRLSGSSSITPIRLAVAADDRLEAIGTSLTVAGWGDTKPGDGVDFADRLREVAVPVVGDAACAAAYTDDGGIAATRELCAGSEGLDSCEGDSGGPLFATKGGSFLQLGIVGWGTGCEQLSHPGVYTEVNSPDIRRFIIANTTTWGWLKSKVRRPGPS